MTEMLGETLLSLIFMTRDPMLSPRCDEIEPAGPTDIAGPQDLLSRTAGRGGQIVLVQE